MTWKYKGVEGSWSQDSTDWCHAGGLRNYAALGIAVEDHENYGLPHVTGWIAEVGVMATNCVFCGAMPL